MKKLFTLLALLTVFMGAKAALKTVVDYEVDYSTETTWSHGWINDAIAPLIALENGALHFKNETAVNFWDLQAQIHPGIQVDNDYSYTITLRMKGTVAQDLHASFSGSNTPGVIPVPTDWQDVVLEGCVNDPSAQYFANSGSLIIQPGDYVGEFWISSIKITHEEQESQRPTEWISVISGNGDAETAWPAWSLEETDGININWRGDRTGEICAWALTMGKNNDTGERKNADGTTTKLDGRARPYPADIEAEAGKETNHVFAVHVDQIAVIDDDNSIQWSNQFWIQSSRAIKAGTKVHLKFRYKAQKATTVATQIHKKTPSDYLHYVAIDNVNFTTEWQEFDKTFTFSDAQNNGWSVAFNLTSASTKDNPQEPNIFYFDDLSWEIVKLDEGWFVASSNAATGIAYDYDNPTELVYDENEDAYVGIVGTVGNDKTWVDEIMISTVCGETTAFKGATIKPSTGTITGNDDSNWQDYTEVSQTKIKLPAAGVWKIFVAPKDMQILFMQLEGETPKQAVDVVTNPEVMVINAVAREDLKDGKNNEGVITVNEEPDDPAGVNVGGEGHNGQTYDNQFFIKANRALQAGEETVVEFKYVATTAARSTTQCHGENPGAYMHWNCIPAVEFTTEEQTYTQNFTVPAEANGMWCISFDLAVMKDANSYTFKDVKWYLKNNEEGKTLENLINATGTENFFVKIGAGTNPYQYGTETGITNVTAKSVKASDVIYNIAGQRVNKDFKGLVIMDGKKIVK